MLAIIIFFFLTKNADFSSTKQSTVNKIIYSTSLGMRLVDVKAGFQPDATHASHATQAKNACVNFTQRTQRMQRNVNASYATQGPKSANASN